VIINNEGEKNMANTVKDLVCGMDIDPATAAGKSDYKGQTYYFCSPGCKKAFDKEPEKYLSKAEQPHQH
jgi:Cu+-exporting ATPase